MTADEKALADLWVMRDHRYSQSSMVLEQPAIAAVRAWRSAETRAMSPEMRQQALWWMPPAKVRKR